MGTATTIGPYELLDELGRGGMGSVYRARHTPTGALRALKLLTGQSDPEAVARFRREAEALAKAGGRGIVPVHDLGVERGQLYFVMSLVAGGSLRQKLKTEGKLPWRDAVQLVAKLAHALSRCHEVGLVHRDVKPDNVLLDEAGEPWLADFGLVRDLGASRLTETGTTLGTLAYMSPEQLEAAPVDARTDVYSLGVLLFECLTGRRPFDERGIVAQRASRAGPRPRLPANECPASLERVLDRALAVAVDRRTPTAARLASDLEAVGLGRALDGERRAAWRPLVAGGTLGLLLAGTIVALAPRGPAEGPRSDATPPPPPAKAPSVQAADLEREGDELLLEGRFADACTAFRKAEDLGLATARRRRGVASLLLGETTHLLDGVAAERSANADLRAFAPLLYKRGLDPALKLDAALRLHGLAWKIDEPGSDRGALLELWRRVAAREGTEERSLATSSSHSLSLEERRQLSDRLTWSWRAHVLDPSGDPERFWQFAADIRQVCTASQPVVDAFHGMFAAGLPVESPTLCLIEARWNRQNGHPDVSIALALRGVDALPPFGERENEELSDLTDALVNQVLELWSLTRYSCTAEDLERLERAALHLRRRGQWGSLGSSWIRLKRLDRAKACLARATVVAANEDDTYHLGFEVLTLEGASKEASALARRWFDESPGAWSRRVLAQTYADQKDWDALLALQSITMGEDLANGDVKHYLALRATAHWRRGERDEARKLVKKFPVLAPLLQDLQRGD